MLFLHSSNHLESLSEQFAALISQPLDNVLAAEQIVVQNAGMGRWLSMQMANLRGISANYELFFPAEYMWELLRKVVDHVPIDDPSKPDVLRWRLFEIFTLRANDYPELGHYLKNDSAAWDLASALAPVLDQYLFYRPEWTKKWESGHYSASDWQARLWQEMIMDEAHEKRQVIHWLELQENFLDAFSKKFDNKQQDFPERVSFFSVPALSPGYLRLLGELSSKTDVHLFVINPCRAYWGDIESRKRLSKRSMDEQSYFDVGNALLASLGQQGRDFIDQLYELSVDIEGPESWVELEEDSVLRCLQADVLNLQESVTDLEERTSIQLHSCHTSMREVEVLHDQILAVLEDDPDVNPSDIVVMTPAIDTYAPYIEAVFSTAEQYLPFSIADRTAVSSKPEVEVFLKLLDLPEQRFNVEAVFELLEYPSIRERFTLDDKQVEQCRSWAQATNIRWGVSREMRVANGLPDTYEHTWKYGLDRMLLGYLMPGEQLFDDAVLLPFNDIEGSNAQVLSSFKSFTDTVFQLWKWVSQREHVEVWVEKLQRLVKGVFPENSDPMSSAGYALIFNSLDAVKKQQNLANFEQKITFNIIKNILRQLLESGGEERFMSRGITFCALVPMRSVPFKMVALLGMNDGDFPRQDQRHSFDKMGKQGRKGDRSRRDEDRYLFLESLLAARKRLYISFIGQSVQDNATLPPSVVVSELLDYLARMTGSDQQRWVVTHPLQAFSPRYYQGDPALFSYVKEYVDVALHQFNELREKRALAPLPFISKALAEPDEAFKQVTLEQLVRFYKSPARVFLQQRFGIQTYDEDDVLPIREPFGLESFVDKQVRQQVASSMSVSAGQNAVKLSRAKGLLPHGVVGDEAFAEEAEVVQGFFKKYPALKQIETHQHAFYLELGEFSLSGTLNHLTPNGSVRYHLGTYYTGELLEIWLHHLVMNSVDLKGVSGYQTAVYQPSNAFKLDAVLDAKAILQILLKGYWSGLQRPLHFFPKSAYKMYAKGGEAKLTEAYSAWKNSPYGGESQKFENQLLFANHEDVFNDEFHSFAKIIFGDFIANCSVL